MAPSYDRCPHHENHYRAQVTLSLNEHLIAEENNTDTLHSLITIKKENDNWVIVCSLRNGYFQ